MLYVYICMYIYVCRYVYACMCVCVCVYVYMYMHIYNYVQPQEHICGRALYKSVIIIIIIKSVLCSHLLDQQCRFVDSSATSCLGLSLCCCQPGCMCCPVGHLSMLVCQCRAGCSCDQWCCLCFCWWWGCGWCTCGPVVVLVVVYAAVDDCTLWIFLPL